jgi:hypothetical protein
MKIRFIQSFIELMNESPCQISIGIWGAICRRLSFSVFAELLTHDCAFCFDRPLNGILSHLTRENGQNIVDSGLISITSSAIGHVFSAAFRDLATVGNEWGFFTADEPNSWICYDFKDMRVTFTDYSIRTRCHFDGAHLRSWRLEGLTDGLPWIEIDRRENDDTTLDQKGAIGAFSIREGNRREFRMIRIRQTGKNSSSRNTLGLASLEFFGVVKRPR